MRIAYIAAGAGNMYCGSCLRDNTLVRSLRELGHQALLVPTYTPLRTDEENQSIARVFYGGIGVFLAQKLPLLRRPLPFLDRLLSAPFLLRAISRLAIRTEPSSLGDLTVSVLRGQDGNQRKALEELVGYLEWEARPEVVHLTNSLLTGLAPSLRARLRVPVVASLQGEDLFLEGLPEVHRRQAVDLIRQGSRAVDLFIAVSRYSADYLASYLGLDRERIRVVRPGVRLEGYPAGERGPRTGPPTIGYLARISPEKGLGFLAEAYRVLREGLARDGAGAPGAPPRLEAAGYLGAAHRPFLSEVEERLRRWGLGGEFRYRGELDRAHKVRFLQEVDVLCVPSTYPEAMGLFAYEALAAGTPLVLPSSGAFREIVEETGGGLLVEPGNPAALAAGLRRVLSDAGLRAELGNRGAEAVRRKFHSGAMAEATLEVYREVLAETPASR